ncbi:transcription termination factor MTERF15, mitochondrial-like [Musa acuminata AAA Group]|uniref:transcription termination factor MTERF15, mitochondrial-like n=1 Tax=Musa acuminata AAA Group TaxID=214697 RepID=UPI0031E1D5D3
MGYCLKRLMFPVQKRLLCLLSCNKSDIYLSSYQLCSLFSFSTAKERSSNHRSNFTLVDPLESCELSSKEAAKRAKDRICENKLSSSSPSIEFFKQRGWSDAQVMKLTQRKPKLIFANVETILKPRMRSLQDMGFSDTEIVQLVSSCPGLLLLRDIQPRINFWRSFLGSNERLIKASRGNMFLLTSSLARKIEPNISLLRECGISEQCIMQMVVALPRFFCRTNKCINESIKHVEELGVSRDCKMFPHAISTVLTLSRSRFDATFATLMSFGWSQPDSLAAFRKHPVIWNYSKKNISDKVTFLTKEAGCELAYIICHPVLLTYSLEKRLRPRYEVMNFLDQNKLLDKGYNLLSVMLLSEEKFRNKFLFLLGKEKFIAQYDSYVVAVQGKPHIVAEN